MSTSYSPSDEDTNNVTLAQDVIGIAGVHYTPAIKPGRFKYPTQVPSHCLKAAPLGSPIRGAMEQAPTKKGHAYRMLFETSEMTAKELGEKIASKLSGRDRYFMSLDKLSHEIEIREIVVNGTSVWQSKHNTP